MAPSKAYHTIRINRKLWLFLLRYAMLTLAVIAGVIILAITGHKEYEALIGAGGIARALELAGEAAADAIAD